VAYGARYGLAGALLSGWPAAAFIGCAEMALGMVRRTAREPAMTPVPDVARVASPEAMQATAPKAARKTGARTGGRGAAAATRAAAEAMTQGQPAPSARALARDHHIGRDKAGQVRAAVLAGTGGHASGPGQLTGT
jgi:hypothetical protein